MQQHPRHCLSNLSCAYAYLTTTIGFFTRYTTAKNTVTSNPATPVTTLLCLIRNCLIELFSNLIFF